MAKAVKFNEAASENDHDTEGDGAVLTQHRWSPLSFPHPFRPRIALTTPSLSHNIIKCYSRSVKQTTVKAVQEVWKCAGIDSCNKGYIGMSSPQKTRTRGTKWIAKTLQKGQAGDIKGRHLASLKESSAGSLLTGRQTKCRNGSRC